MADASDKYAKLLSSDYMQDNLKNSASADDDYEYGKEDGSQVEHMSVAPEHPELADKPVAEPPAAPCCETKSSAMTLFWKIVLLVLAVVVFAATLMYFNYYKTPAKSS